MGETTRIILDTAASFGDMAWWEGSDELRKALSSLLAAPSPWRALLLMRAADCFNHCARHEDQCYFEEFFSLHFHGESFPVRLAFGEKLHPGTWKQGVVKRLDGSNQWTLGKDFFAYDWKYVSDTGVTLGRPPWYATLLTATALLRQHGKGEPLLDVGRYRKLSSLNADKNADKMSKTALLLQAPAPVATAPRHEHWRCLLDSTGTAITHLAQGRDTVLELKKQVPFDSSIAVGWMGYDHCVAEHCGGVIFRFLKRGDYRKLRPSVARNFLFEWCSRRVNVVTPSSRWTMFASDGPPFCGGRVDVLLDRDLHIAIGLPDGFFGFAAQQKHHTGDLFFIWYMLGLNSADPLAEAAVIMHRMQHKREASLAEFALARAAQKAEAEKRFQDREIARMSLGVRSLRVVVRR